MIKIAHRINTISQLNSIEKSYGIECDIRSANNTLILHHDPFEKGTPFEDFLTYFNHAFIILNTKEEGLEIEILNLLKKYNISNFFFLDLSLPFLIRYAKKGVSNIAIRYSEYEPLELCKKFSSLVDWVWVDCFNGTPPSIDTLNELQTLFKICLVSPELQSFSKDSIQRYQTQLSSFKPDAVCTKFPNLW